MTTSYYGGVCLDGLNEIPDNYKSILYIGKDVIIKTERCFAVTALAITFRHWFTRNTDTECKYMTKFTLDQIALSTEAGTEIRLYSKTQR